MTEMLANPPSLDGYTKYCQSHDIMEYAFPNGTPFCEAHAIRSVLMASDKGRYGMKMLMVQGKQSALPAYLASVGHDVWLMDSFKKRQDLRFQLDMKLKTKLVIIQDRFLTCNKLKNEFKMICLIDCIGKSTHYVRHKNLISDKADSLYIAKARSCIINTGMVYFTLEILENPEKQAALVMKNDLIRRYTPNEAQERILSLCEKTTCHAHDTISLQQCWLAR